MSIYRLDKKTCVASESLKLSKDFDFALSFKRKDRVTDGVQLLLYSELRFAMFSTDLVAQIRALKHAPEFS